MMAAADMNIIDRDNRTRRVLAGASALLATPFIWWCWPLGLLWLILPAMFLSTGPSRFDGYTKYARHACRSAAKAFPR